MRAAVFFFLEKKKEGRGRVPQSSSAKRPNQNPFDYIEKKGKGIFFYFSRESSKKARLSSSRRKERGKRNHLYLSTRHL